jgi:hypothetical protein
MSSTRIKQYTPLLEDPFFKAVLVNNKRPENDRKDDWLRYALETFNISEADIQTELGKPNIVCGDVKNKIKAWNEFHNITEPNLVHSPLAEGETEEIRMLKVTGVLKAMGITYGDETYGRARKLAMESEFWPNRPHAGKAYSSANLATQVSGINYIFYCLLLILLLLLLFHLYL